MADITGEDSPSIVTLGFTVTQLFIFFIVVVAQTQFVEVALGAEKKPVESVFLNIAPDVDHKKLQRCDMSYC